VKAPANEPRAASLRNRRVDLLAVAGLFVVVLATHGGSLNDGLFFDDHWHRTTLRDYGWSFHDLIESATFDVPGRLAHLWWQEQPLQWRYARPVAMFFMKLEYLLTGGNPVAVHACALGWHALTSTLVYLLARWAIGHRAWAFAAGALFAFQPHSVFGVSWIAARNVLVSAFFFLAAVYLYVSAAAPHAGTDRGPTTAARFSRARLAGVVLLWGLALFSRETAIIFPLLIVVLDLSHGGRRLVVRRLPVYVVTWLVAGVYLYWRLDIFPTTSPPRIYFTAPGGPAYVAWAVGKLLHMLFALIFTTPLFVGLETSGTANPTHPYVYVAMIVLLSAGGLWYALASRGARARWFWPSWVVMAFVPVIPVFVTPHFAYLPAAPLAVMLGIVLSRLRRWWRPIVTTVLVAGYLWSFGVYRYLWRGIVRSEQLIYADIHANTLPPEPGSKLFFINLPISGVYATAAMRQAWGLDDLEGYVLTFAPHPLAMMHPCVVQQVGDRELIVSTEPPGYFSGVSGRMVRAGTRPDSPLTSGTVVSGGLFDATVLAGDERGITRLKFSFRQPLDSPDFCFYVSSPQRPACRLRFGGERLPIDPAQAALFEQARADAPEQRRSARQRIVELARPLAVQTASPIQAALRERPLSDGALDRVEDWWRSIGASELLSEDAAWRERHADFLRERDRFFQIDRCARHIIRSDLLLTGRRDK
jgi:hypothetical protein